MKQLPLKKFFLNYLNYTKFNIVIQSPIYLSIK